MINFKDIIKLLENDLVQMHFKVQMKIVIYKQILKKKKIQLKNRKKCLKLKLKALQEKNNQVEFKQFPKIKDVLEFLKNKKNFNDKHKTFI